MNQDKVEAVARAIMEAEPYNLSPDEAMNCARAAIEALSVDDRWRDIASAPKDEEIDIWVSGPGARRIADCRWGKPSQANWGDRYGNDKDLPEQWITRSGSALDRRNGVATHWQPLPAPPLAEQSGMEKEDE